MEVLLRKASTLARAAAQAASKIDLTPTLKLSPYAYSSSDATRLLATASNGLIERMAAFTALQQAVTTIRRLIGEANASSKVNALLTERDYLNSMEKMLSAFLDGITQTHEETSRRRLYSGDNAVRVRHDGNLVHTTLLSLRERSGSTSGADVPNVEVPALEPNAVFEVEKQLAGIRRRRADLMDELAAANLNKKITLPQNVVVTLRSHQIIE